MPKKAAAAKKSSASPKKKPGRPPKAATQKTGRKKTGRKKTATKKAAAKKTAAGRGAAKKTAAKKTTTGRGAAKKTAAKKTAAKKTAAKKTATKRGAGGRKAAPRAARKTGDKLLHPMLRELEPQLAALSSRDVVAPNIPVERLVAEGVELATVAWRDLAKLGSAGLDRNIVIALGKRSQALAEAQAELVTARSRGRTSEEEDLIAESTELRSEVLAAGRLALRRDPIAQSKLDDIIEGEGLDDLLQDLQDLAALLRAYSAAFAKVGLKPSELANWSETLRLRLSKHLAERRAGDAETAAKKDLRDRAATLLSDAVSITRLTGAYVFRKDPRRLLNYRSAYNAELRARAARRAREEAPAPAADKPAAPTE